MTESAAPEGLAPTAEALIQLRPSRSTTSAEGGDPPAVVSRTRG